MTLWRPRVVSYAPPGGTTSPERNRPRTNACAPAFGIAGLIELRTAACADLLHLRSEHTVPLAERVRIRSAVGAGAGASREQQGNERYQARFHGDLRLHG